jgi:hypothetical protein
MGHGRTSRDRNELPNAVRLIMQTNNQLLEPSETTCFFGAINLLFVIWN